MMFNLGRLFAVVRTRARSLFTRYANKRTATALIIVVVFLGFGVVKALLSSTDKEAVTVRERQVQTAPAGLATNVATILESTGELKSQTEGDLRAQKAGVITSVNVGVGDSVRAGTIIASIENASERASVAQAEAGVAQAQANLNKVVSGTRGEQLAVLAATTANAQQTLSEAVVSAKNSLLSAYASTDDIFSGGVDEMFSDASKSNPQLLFTSQEGSAKSQAEHERFLLQTIIARHATAPSKAATYNAEQLLIEVATVESELITMKEMLDNLITALDGAVAGGSITTTTISTYKTTATSARTTVLSTLSTLSGVRSSLNSAKSALTIAQENESQGIVGAQQEDIDVAQAQLESAQATFAQSIAQLENTRVRAPVSGVVTILSVEPGDFVTAFQSVGLIANKGALEVQTFISPNVVSRITVGSNALIESKYAGVVTSIAPGLDPVKRQVEVRVAVTDENVSIPHGSRVEVEFLNAVVEEEVTQEKTIVVPVAALKLIGDDVFVFTISSENTLIARPVTLGSVVQSSVEIVEGIDYDTVIVLDARGLNEGDVVIVENTN